MDGHDWPELPAPGAGPPRVTLRRSIDCLLFKGPVSATCNFRSRLWFQSPTAGWPDDHAWCVTTDVDSFSTYIAGTGECIGVLASDPRLEILATQVGHEVDPSPYPPRQQAPATGRRRDARSRRQFRRDTHPPPPLLRTTR